MPIAAPILPNILVINTPSAPVPAALKSLAHLHIIQQPPTIALFLEALRELFASTDAPFVGCVFFTNWGAKTPFPFPPKVLRCLVEQGGVGCISGMGAGYDGVDVELLEELGCYWANNPIAVGLRTADSTAMMIQQVLRGTSQIEARMRKGLWRDPNHLIKDARSSTLGIIGMGHIGSIVAQHLQNLGMHVIYSKRSRLSPSDEHGCEYVSFDELLARSDVISLTCPLTTETRHILNADTFSRMKKNVCIVNTARGGCIDEDALIEALQTGKVLRAALDVYENEPSPDPELLALDSVILSPHVAALNETMTSGNELEIMDNMRSFLSTGKPNTPVNGWDW